MAHISKCAAEPGRGQPQCFLSTEAAWLLSTAAGLGRLGATTKPATAGQEMTSRLLLGRC
jgi:hypothetical protein